MMGNSLSLPAMSCSTSLRHIGEGTKNSPAAPRGRHSLPRVETGLTTEAKQSTEPGEVGIPLRTIQIPCTTSVQNHRFRDVLLSAAFVLKPSGS